MIQLVEHHRCRQQNILRYFGEENVPCKICDRCLAMSDQIIRSDAEIDEIRRLGAGEKVHSFLLNNPKMTTYLVDEKIIEQKGKTFYRK